MINNLGDKLLRSYNSLINQGKTDIEAAVTIYVVLERTAAELLAEYDEDDRRVGEFIREGLKAYPLKDTTEFIAKCSEYRKLLQGGLH